MISEVLLAERALRRAVLAADVDALDRLLAEDVVFVGPDGALVDKAADLAAHRSGAMRIVRYEPVGEPIVALIAEGVARLLATLDVAVEIGGTTHEGRFLYTRVFALRDGRPQVVLAQAAPALVD